MQSDDAKTRLLVKIARLYYDEGRNQEEIGKELSLSRSKISRMLSRAQELGIVRITVHDPLSGKSQIERLLATRFGLREAVVASSTTEVSALRASVAMAAGALIENLVTDGDIIGVNAGTTLSDTCEVVRSLPRPHSLVVPLVGGLGPSGARWQANLSTRTLAQRLGCEYLQLNAPAFVSSPGTKQSLLEEAEIRDVLRKGGASDLAIVGIGDLTAESTLMQTGLIDAEVHAELLGRGAVADVCNSFVDADGALVPFSGYDRMIGVKVDELQDARAVVGVAAGSDKATAIRAALRGGWLTHFVTDADTAKSVLSEA